MADTTFLPSTASANVALSNGNLTATASSTAIGGVQSQDSQNAGQFYVEFTYTTIAGGSTGAGFCTPAATYTGLSSGNGLLGLVVYKSGTVRLNGATAVTIGALSNGALVCAAIDLTNMRAWFRLGATGNWNNSASATPATPSTGIDISGVFSTASPAWPFAVFDGGASDQITANFGASAFVGAVPTGFTAGWPTQTIPTALVATQAGAEVWGQNTSPPLRVTQLGAEAWGSNTSPPLRVTQLGAEVWLNLAAPYVPPAPAAGYVGMCVIT